MLKRKLGKTGIEVSEIAFGGVEIGMPYGIGIRRVEDMLSEKEAVHLLHSAIELGINFFDTARMYGNSETIMGKAFKDRRDKIVLVTKCRHLLDKDGNFPPDSELIKMIEKSLKESLKALQTDHVDIFMLHQANKKILENEMVIVIFDKLKRQGLFKATGVSTYTTDETKKAIERGYWDIIQLPFNMMDQRQSSLFGEAYQNGVGIVIRSVLLKGLLSDRGKNLHPALKDVENHISRYKELLNGKDMNLPSYAVKFALSFPEISSVLVGIDREEYLKAILTTADGNYFEAETLKRAKEFAYSDPEFIDLPYWDKMNWLR